MAQPESRAQDVESLEAFGHLRLAPAAVAMESKSRQMADVRTIASKVLQPLVLSLEMPHPAWKSGSSVVPP